MVWYTYKLSSSHLSRASAISVVDCCQIGPSWIFELKIELTACSDLVDGTAEKSVFSWPYMIVSMTWNTSELSASHLSRARALLLLIAANKAQAGCLGWNGAYGLCRLGWQYSRAKLDITWPYMIVSKIWNALELSSSHLSRATTIFVVDCCQFGPSWIFEMKI